MKNTIHILYGTTTGNSEGLAEETAEKLNSKGRSAVLQSMEEVKVDDLYKIETLLVIVSTDSGGSPPFTAVDLHKSLSNKTKADMQHLSYSVLGLGDSYYLDFCQTGKDFDRMLKELGARRIAERVDCDIDYWEAYDRWFDNVLSVIGPKEAVLK